MARDKWQCQLRYPGCAGAASQCDHIVSVADGGGHDVGNLRAVCTPCHHQRSSKQSNDGRRGRGSDPPATPRTAW